MIWLPDILTLRSRKLVELLVASNFMVVYSITFFKHLIILKIITGILFCFRMNY